MSGGASRALPPEGLLIALLAAITASAPVSLNIFLAALPSVQAEFGVTVAEANVTISAGLLSFATGVFLYGPLSDRHGRRPMILVGLAIAAVGNIACLLAPTLDLLVAGRVLQGFGTAAGVVVARAILGDLFEREKMARMLAYLTMVMIIVPTVAPLVGGLLTEAFGWHSVFACMLVATVVVAWLAWRWLPETRPAGLHGATLGSILKVSGGLLRRPMFLGYTLQSSVIYATFLTFISLIPYVMAELGHPATVYGLWYLLVAGGYFLGNWYVTRIGPRLGPHRLMVLGAGMQFVGAGVGLALMLAGFWHPAAIFLPMFVMGAGQGMALPNVTASAVALARNSAGAASSMLGFSQQMVGALSVQAMALLPATTPVPVYVFCAATAALAFGAVLVLPDAEKAR